jgi:hypothetical protein
MVVIKDAGMYALSHQYYVGMHIDHICIFGIAGPANQNGCIILHVGKIADEKF